jgi:putative transposase
MYHHHDFPNHMAARTAVMEYIESWYNRRRPHANNQGLPRHAPWPNTKTRSTR